MKTHNILNTIKIYPDEPSSDVVPAGIDNKNVIIIDVAYKKHVLEKIIERANFTLHIDHHVTIRNDVMDLETRFSPNKFISYYDVNESGASLVWKYFYEDLQGVSVLKPKFITYIKDNDIGAWKHTNTMPFITALNVNYKLEPTPENLLSWDKLLSENEVKNLISTGNTFLEYQNYLLEQNVKKHSIELFPGYTLYKQHKNFFKKPGQYKVAFVNGSGCPNVSILGKKIVNEINCDFCIFLTVNFDKKLYILSFRSKSVDVGKICAVLGGGGHMYAAACSLPIKKYKLHDLFYSRH